MTEQDFYVVCCKLFFLILSFMCIFLTLLDSAVILRTLMLNCVTIKDISVLFQHGGSLHNMSSSWCRCEEHSHLKTVWRMNSFWTRCFCRRSCRDGWTVGGHHHQRPPGCLHRPRRSVPVPHREQRRTGQADGFRFSVFCFCSRLENRRFSFAEPQINSALRLQVTYRVVQVTEDQLEAEATGAVSVVSAAAFTGAPQAVAQVGPETTQTAITVFWIRGSSRRTLVPSGTHFHQS